MPCYILWAVKQTLDSFSSLIEIDSDDADNCDIARRGVHEELSKVDNNVGEKNNSNKEGAFM